MEKTGFTTKKLLCILVSILSALITFSCATRHYQQPVKSGDAPTAIIRNGPGFSDDLFYTSTVLLHSVDGRDAKDYGKGSWTLEGNSFNSQLDGDFEVEIAPGRHTLIVSYHRGTMRGSRYSSALEISFVAVSGHSYVIYPVDNVPDKWRPAINDVTDKANPQLVPSGVSTDAFVAQIGDIIKIIRADGKARLCPKSLCGDDPELLRIPANTELEVEGISREHFRWWDGVRYKVTYNEKTGWVDELDTDKAPKGMLRPYK
jgi:hypothetical protein